MHVFPRNVATVHAIGAAMRPNTPHGPQAQRLASGRYVTRLRDPLDPRRRIRLTADTQHALASLVDLVRMSEALWRAGRKSATELRRDLDLLEHPELARTKAIGELWAEHVERAAPRRRANLAALYRGMLESHFGRVLACDMTPPRLDTWARAMAAEGYAPTTIVTAWRQLVAAVRPGVPDPVPWLVRGATPWRPPSARHVERPACTTVDELAALVTAAHVLDAEERARGRFADLAHRIAVAALCSLRNGELAGLGWDCVDLERARLRVRFQAFKGWRELEPSWDRPRLPPKGGRERTIALHPDAVRALHAQRALLEARGWFREDGPVFPTPYGGDWRPNNRAILTLAIRAAAERAGLHDAAAWVAHSLRHSGATLEAEGGATVRAVAARSGHESLSVVERYIHAARLPASRIGALQVRFAVEEEHTPAAPAVSILQAAAEAWDSEPDDTIEEEAPPVGATEGRAE